MEFDYSTIEDKFNSLPEEVKFAMTSPAVSQKIRSISEKFGLLLDQMDVLFDITSYVMLGLLPQSQFTPTLARELNINEKQARLITSEISDNVFSSIRESMRQYELQNQPQTKTVQENYSANSGKFGKIDNINSNNNKEAAAGESESIHADLENAGNFKIETETPTELELLRERREYMEKQRALDMQKMISNIPKDTPLVSKENLEIKNNSITPERSTDNTPENKIDINQNISTTTQNIQTSLNKLETSEENREVKNSEKEPVKVAEKTNFDPFSYYNFNLTEENPETSKNETKKESVVEKEFEESNQEDNLGIKEETEKDTDPIDVEPIKEEVVKEKKEIEVPANLPVIEEKQETIIPNQSTIEPEKLEETKKNEETAQLPVSSDKEVAKNIENNEQTPKQSINLLDKKDESIKTVEPVTNEEPSTEELRDDIRKQVNENNSDHSQNIVNSNNIKKAEKMLEDTDIGINLVTENKQDQTKTTTKQENIPNPVIKIDPYREPIE